MCSCVYISVYKKNGYTSVHITAIDSNLSSLKRRTKQKLSCSNHYLDLWYFCCFCFLFWLIKFCFVFFFLAFIILTYLNLKKGSRILYIIIFSLFIYFPYPRFPLKIIPIAIKTKIRLIKQQSLYSFSSYLLHRTSETRIIGSRDGLQKLKVERKLFMDHGLSQYKRTNIRMNIKSDCRRG